MAPGTGILLEQQEAQGTQQTGQEEMLEAEQSLAQSRAKTLAHTVCRGGGKDQDRAGSKERLSGRISGGGRTAQGQAQAGQGKEGTASSLQPGKLGGGRAPGRESAHSRVATKAAS